MIPTVETIRTQSLELLDNVSGSVFDPSSDTAHSTWQAAFKYAYGEFYNEALRWQLSKIENSTTYTLPASTTSLTPATIGISDFGEIIWLGERDPSQTTVDYSEIKMVDRLPTRGVGTTLREYTWTNDTFQFVGASVSRQLLLRYFVSGSAPTTGSVGIDGSEEFFATAVAYRLAQRKGFTEAAREFKQQAFGPRWDETICGGMLRRLLEPMVRNSVQRQCQPRPYGAGTAYRRNLKPWTIQAAGATGGDTPGFLSSVTAGQITGSIDGINAVFYLSISPTSAQVYVGGQLQDPAVAYSLAANTLTFNPGYVPASGATIQVTYWL